MKVRTILFIVEETVGDWSYFLKTTHLKVFSIYTPEKNIDAFIKRFKAKINKGVDDPAYIRITVEDKVKIVK